jgi:hemerythrin superfamily protein
MTQTNGSRDVVDLLIKDHREVESLFQQLEAGQGKPDHRRQVADVVIAELVRHSVAEEAYVYPAARKALPDGDQVADHEISEHAEAERTMKELEAVDATDPRFDQLLSQLTRIIRHHIEDEESDLFRRLREACSRDELVALAGKVQAAKKAAPTRPHPAAPDRPPANKMLAPGAGLVDRMRDALSGRPTTVEDLRR